MPVAQDPTCTLELTVVARVSRLVGEQEHHQAGGFAEQRAVSIGHGRGDEDLAAVDFGDATMGAQRLVDRGDAAVVDMEVGGAGRPNFRGATTIPNSQS